MCTMAGCKKYKNKINEEHETRWLDRPTVHNTAGSKKVYGFERVWTGEKKIRDLFLQSIFFTHRETGETVGFRWHACNHKENIN